MATESDKGNRLGRSGRMTVRRKREAAIRLLKGEDLELVSRELCVTAASLSRWREAFLSGGENALKARAGDSRDDRIRQLEAKLGRMTMDCELLREKIAVMEQGRPFGRRRPRR
jgi:transposase